LDSSFAIIDDHRLIFHIHVFIFTRERRRVYASVSWNAIPLSQRVPNPSYYITRIIMRENSFALLLFCTKRLLKIRMLWKCECFYLLNPYFLYIVSISRTTWKVLLKATLANLRYGWSQTK